MQELRDSANNRARWKLFVARPCSEQSLAKKENKKTNPIRSERMFLHVPISSKLAHFLLKNSKQIHILKKIESDKNL
jgi:hypothetical protein